MEESHIRPLPNRIPHLGNRYARVRTIRRTSLRQEYAPVEPVGRHALS